MVFILAAGSMSSAADMALAKGRLALADGFHRLAEAEFRSVMLREDAEQGELASAADYILQSRFEQERFDLLADELEQFAAGGALDEAAAVFWRAMLREAAEDRAGALEILAWFETEAGRRSVYAPRGLRLRALLLFKEGDPARASAVFEGLSRTYTNAPARLYNRLDWGLILLSADDPARAQAAWAPLTVETNMPPSLSADARYWSAQAHLRTGAVTAAESLLSPLAADAGLDEARRVRAVFALSEARRLAADAAGGTVLLTNLMASIRAPDLRKQVEYQLALHLLGSGDLAAAAPRVRAFVGAHPSDPDAPGLLLRLGDAFLGVADYAGADGVFQQALEVFGESQGAAQRGRALALSGLGRDAEAALVFERASSMLEDSSLAADSLFRAGDRYFAAGQYRKALAAYDRFLGGVESDLRSALVPRAKYQRGASLAALGGVEEAVESFESVAREYPESPEAANALLSIGDLHLSRERFALAEAAFERVAGAYPEGPVFRRALHGRGMARYHQWDAGAIDDFERIAADEKAEPAMSEHARFMQAMCLYRLGRDAQALQMCREFRERFPASALAPQAHFWVARFEYNSGNDEAAETEFLSFVSKYPDHELAAQGLLRAGLSAARRQQYLAAIEQFGRMAKQYPRSGLLAEARFHQAEAMVQLGRFAAAILVYEEVINSGGDQELTGMAWGRKGDCQFTLGADDTARYEAAIQSYLAVLNIPGLRLDHALQAAYKLGLTCEKLGRTEDALDWYYSRVMLPFLLERESGGSPGESARTWFSRAARGAADIAEGRRDWRRLVRILERAAAADVEFSAEAGARMRSVKSEYWWMFY